MLKYTLSSMCPTAIYHITSFPVVGDHLRTISATSPTCVGYQVCDIAVSGNTLIMLRSGGADNRVLFYELN